MMFYCVKCKQKKEVEDYETATWKNLRSAVKAKCPDCGTDMYRILPLPKASEPKKERE